MSQRTGFIRRRGQAERRQDSSMAADKPRWTEPPLGGGKAAVRMGSVRFSDPRLARDAGCCERLRRPVRAARQWQRGGAAPPQSVRTVRTTLCHRAGERSPPARWRRLGCSRPSTQVAHARLTVPAAAPRSVLPQIAAPIWGAATASCAAAQAARSSASGPGNADNAPGRCRPRAA